MAGKNMFADLFAPQAPSLGYAAKPITIALNHDDVPPEELGDVLKFAIPGTHAGTSPQVIKFLDGEYLVYADGSVEFIPRGGAYTGRSFPQ